MIAFDSVSREEMEAMCTPMHCIISPTPIGGRGASKRLSSSTHTKNNENITLAADIESTLAPALAPTPVTMTGALYLGSMAAAHDVDLLRTHKIAHLVQVLEVPWMPAPDNTEFACYRIDIEDTSSAKLQPHLEEACDYIRTTLSRGENVLVHCQQGVSRSASIVIAYLIREHSLSYDAAFDIVRQRRRCIKPNAGFIKTLREWESDCNQCKMIPRAASR
ncbi:Phosphatases II [Mycena sanguinolenta]|uniref:protein-tyrosine-phosphatase n=1 Tax=Mycena sanguinolenta TaxID=230812 RepID=A0A8H6Z576_9AGAR|nr:Phosphatases II [Mycena sanguinolenta]